MIESVIISTLAGSVICTALLIFKNKILSILSGKALYYISLLAMLIFILPMNIGEISLPKAPIHQQVNVTEFNTKTKAEKTDNALIQTVRQEAQQETQHNVLPKPSKIVRRSNPITIQEILIAVWLLGFIILMCRYLISYFRFKKKICGFDTHEVIDGVDVIKSTIISSPLVFGFFKPTLAIPEIKMNEDDYKLAIKHEMVHYKHHDSWFKLFAVIVNSIYWFNPITYLMVNLIGEACEYACDEQVTKEMDMSDRKQYSTMILSMVCQTSPALSSNMVKNKKQLKRRFEMIMKKKKFSVWGTTLCNQKGYIMQLPCPAGDGVLDFQNTKVKIGELNITAFFTGLNNVPEEYDERSKEAAEIIKLPNTVKKFIVPSAVKLNGINVSRGSKLSMTDEEILEELKFCFADVSGEMSDAFMYMLDKNMYDITYSEDKYPSHAATIYLYNPGTPFLFASPSEDNAGQLGTVIHEFGHFNTMLYDPVNQENNIGTFDATNIDTAEVNSLGLEALMTNYYNRFYGKDENAYTLSLIYYLLGNVIDGCVINEFELAAIKNPNMSVDELNRTYRKIGESYGMTFMTDDEMAYGWVRTQHIFTQPFYYISYATSSMAALDIWSGIDDFDVAKDRYLKFCALGDHISFKEALSEVGIHNVFEEKCSIILAEQITEEFGFDYEDVKHDEWYYNAVFFSLPYVDGLSDVKYGINQNASRGIIATGIAGLCRGENVESKAKFTDIPANNKVYINWAYDNGIIYGYDDTLFGYSDDVTREQAVVMLYRCAEFLGTDNSEASSQIIYTDADAVSDWAVEAVSWASSIGIIRGYEDGTFKPFNNVTKAEFAQMLYTFADVVH